MSVREEQFNDRDERAVWALIGRHRPIEPSFGFAERTLRRLNEAPRPASSVLSIFWQPVFRWATLAVVALLSSFILLMRAHRASRAIEPEVAVYAKAQDADYLEDFDVIASLDQLDRKGDSL